VKIDYNASKDFFDTREVRRFHYEYIEPLGWPRKAVELAPEAIVIRANRSGLLSLSARLVDVGLGRLNDLILEEVERPDRGIWSGDLLTYLGRRNGVIVRFLLRIGESPC